MATEQIIDERRPRHIREADPAADRALHRLNLGAGDKPIEGYWNIDAAYDAQDMLSGQIPLTQAPCEALSFVGDESCAEVRASHLLEHFGHAETIPVLQEWTRVLAPGGWLKIAVPDFRKLVAVILDPGAPAESSAVAQLALLGGQANERDYHKAIFDEDGLAALLQHVGLVDIQRWESEIDDCAASAISLNLMGRKPLEGERADQGYAVTMEDADEGAYDPSWADHPDARCAGCEIKHGDIALVMTHPRFGPVQSLFSIADTLRFLNAPIIRTGGAFWTQGMQNGLTMALQTGAKYILTFDYDSVFDQRDIEVLYSYMEASPSIDALCPVQMQRDFGRVILGMHDADGNPRAVTTADFASDVMPASTGHFGLTMIRTQALARIPKPWFVEHPDANGEYSPDRMDADIHFWNAWMAAGNTLYVANRVVIGHIETVVTWPDRQLRPITQTVGDYHANGRPPRGSSNLWR